MILTAPLPRIEIEHREAASGAASDLAAGFLRYASSCWRGDRRAAAFPVRLSAYWRPTMPPAPEAAPAAVSPHGAGGRGIVWYELGEEVLGYVPGESGGFQTPVQAIPGLVRCASATA